MATRLTPRHSKKCTRPLASGPKEGLGLPARLAGDKPLLTSLRYNDRFDDAGLKDKLISEPGTALRAFGSNPWLSWDAPNG
jgi:hypothetical protein